MASLASLASARRQAGLGFGFALGSGLALVRLDFGWISWIWILDLASVGF